MAQRLSRDKPTIFIEQSAGSPWCPGWFRNPLADRNRFSPHRVWRTKCWPFRRRKCDTQGIGYHHRQVANARLPADSFIGSRSIRAARLIEMDQINHDVLRAKVFGNMIFARRFVAQDHNFCAPHHGFEVG